MFSEKELDAYRQIKAPEELRMKIETQVVQNKRNSFGPVMKAVTAMAACLVFVIAFNTFFKNEPIQMTVNGCLLEDEIKFSSASPAMAMRAVPVCSVPVELELDEKTIVSVSEGFLIVNDGEPVETIEVSEDVKIWWNIPCMDEKAEYEMQIKQDGEITLITLISNPTDGTITARKSTK